MKRDEHSDTLKLITPSPLSKKGLTVVCGCTLLSCATTEGEVIYDDASFRLASGFARNIDLFYSTKLPELFSPVKTGTAAQTVAIVKNAKLNADGGGNFGIDLKYLGVLIKGGAHDGSYGWNIGFAKKRRRAKQTFT